ncbi:YbaY family lipoprotein [Dyella subtropica]|uniref:YbaY family lipoprotein n=1 Tax=Dyella subtropica TaxID=2992127 RepID=UPI00224E3CED|nr:YbaY family lipoprotein [Dyella subtropica]
MRRLVWSLMSVAALALAGCNSSDKSQPAAQGGEPATAAAGPAAKANAVSGTVTLRDAAQLSPQAKLEIKLIDVTAQDAPPLASKTIDPAASMPQSFELDFNPADVNPADIIIVQAVLTDGDRRYTAPLQSPVLTKGAASQVSIQLVGEQTPGEKQLAAFNGVQKQIGGMKITPGQKLEANVSRSWQVFREAGEVKFIREQVDYGDKGFTSTDYGFKDGKPWVVVQQKKASKDAKPTSTERAGWNGEGALVLKQTQAGSKTEVLGDDEAASLQKQAQAILSLATGGKGK